jgi:hypothetical protein
MMTAAAYYYGVLPEYAQEIFAFNFRDMFNNTTDDQWHEFHEIELLESLWIN